MVSWAKDIIYIVRPASKTVRGSVVPDWEHATTNMVTGCSVQAASTGLSEDGRVLGISDGLTVYCPPGIDVQAGDRVRYNGRDYVIDGEPKRWNSATGLQSNIQLNIMRCSG